MLLGYATHQGYRPQPPVKRLRTRVAERGHQVVGQHRMGGRFGRPGGGQHFLIHHAKHAPGHEIQKPEIAARGEVEMNLAGVVAEHVPGPQANNGIGAKRAVSV